MAKVYSKLAVGNSLKVLGMVPDKYAKAVKASLLKAYPTATKIKVASEAKPADETSRERYTLLTASGEVPDAPAQ